MYIWWTASSYSTEKVEINRRKRILKGERCMQVELKNMICRINGNDVQEIYKFYHYFDLYVSSITCRYSHLSITSVD